MDIIKNIDQILDVLKENNPLTCDIFKGFEGTYLPKEKSIAEVSLLQINLKNLSFGCAVKMWVNWNKIDKSKILKEIQDKESELKPLLSRAEYLRIWTLNPLKNARHKKELKILTTEITQRKTILGYMKSSLEKIQYLSSMAYDRSYDALTYEKRVYEYITDNIILKHYSPNFIPLLGFLTCSLGTIKEGFNTERLKDLHYEKSLNYKTIGTAFPDIPVNVMITGSSAKNGGTMQSMREFLTKLNGAIIPGALSEFQTTLKHTFYSVLFQCIYSLAIMEFFSIVHNDLHLDNILVHSTGTFFDLNFITPKTQVRMWANYIVKIFDWNLAYVKKLGDNPLLNTETFVQYHQINKARTKQDFYQLLCGMSSFKNLWQIVVQLLPSIPKERNFYYYNKDEPRKLQTHQYGDSDVFDPFIDYLSVAPSNEIIIPADGNCYIEIPKRKFAKIFSAEPDAFDQIKKFIGENRYDIAETLYFRLVFKMKGIVVPPAKVLLESDTDAAIIDQIDIIVLTGWYCQSLHDVDTSIIPSPMQLINNDDFVKGLIKNFYNFGIELNDEKIASLKSNNLSFTYTFPKL
jgi:hypothetical protein